MELENDEVNPEDQFKPRDWYKRLSNRLKATLAFKNLLHKPEPNENLQHLFEAPIHKDNRDQNLKVIEDANTPVIWIIGGPGAPIQAFVDRLAKVYRFHHVNVGQILKKEIIVATGRGEMVNKLMHRGVVIPRQFLNEIIMRDMADAIEMKNVRGFLFSDYPTSFTQAKTFLKKVQKVDFVLVLKFNENTMRLNAFNIIRRQSLSSKRLSKTKEELRTAAEEEVKNYNKDLSLLYKHYGKKIKIIEGQLEISAAYKEIMRWIERAMVIRNMMPPFLPDVPVKPTRLGSRGSAGSVCEL